MYQQSVVSIKDLRFATLACPRCNTRVTVDLNAEFEPESRRRPFVAPRACPRCDTPFDSAVPEAVDSLQEVYKALAKLGSAVTFTANGDQSVPPPPPPAK
jgi:hypothetical protein